MPFLNIPAKPYVKHYLELAYGTPVDLTGNPRLNTFIRRSLRKPSSRYDNRYSKMFSKNYYATTVDIVISDDDFYRYGWEITRTDTVSFNREVEEVVKFFMRTSVAMYENFMQQKDAIRTFQEKFGFNDDIWSFEAIRKDFYRSSNILRSQLRTRMKHKIEWYEKKVSKKFRDELIEETVSFFMVNLSRINNAVGTSSQLVPREIIEDIPMFNFSRKNHSG